jgi:hypothetical protein
MSQRDSGYARKERDLYETPEWVTAALIPHLPRRPSSIYEPACGSGKMVRALQKALPGAAIIGADIEPGPTFLRLDFLRDGHAACARRDAIITNPPYDLAREFTEHALRLMEANQGMVAMLLRTDFDHARLRQHLFGACPVFAKKLVLTKRIVWFVEENGKPKAAPSFNHAWFIWDHRHCGPPTMAWQSVSPAARSQARGEQPSAPRDAIADAVSPGADSSPGGICVRLVGEGLADEMAVLESPAPV